jgi:SOS response associated peptidase (SRAP)
MGSCICGRYELVDGQRVFIRFRVTNKAAIIPDNADIRPAQQVLAIQTDHVLSVMQWDLVPSWAKDPHIGPKMINARAEGIESKPSFRKPLRFQRCSIPASAFFEWKGNPGSKVKYRIARKDGDLFGPSCPRSRPSERGHDGVRDACLHPVNVRITTDSSLPAVPDAYAISSRALCAEASH